MDSDELIDLFSCRVCGLVQCDPPWGLDGKTSTFNICDCCGVEFGYEDNSVSAAKKYRAEWLAAGAAWNDLRRKPLNWSLAKQLMQIPELFK